MLVWLQRILLAVWLIRAIPCSAQDPAGGQPSSEPPVTATPTPQDKRVFGVLPNYRTADANVPYTPISAKRKMTIACQDSFDWPVYPTAALFAALYHLENQN